MRSRSSTRLNRTCCIVSNASFRKQDKEEKKRRQKEEKMKQMQQNAVESDDDSDDLEDMKREAALMKKLKRGKISQKYTFVLTFFLIQQRVRQADGRRI